jgi:hypothetical protein
MHIMNKIKLSPIKNFGYSVQHIIMTAGNVQHIILYKGKNTLVSDNKVCTMKTFSRNQT